MTVVIDFKFPDWAARVKEHEAEINLFIAAQVQTNRGMLFDKEGALNGRPRWPDLKLRAGQILSRRGTLRKSIAPFNPNGRPGQDGIVRFEGETIVVGTKLFYARMMNNGTKGLPGGVLRPVRAKALKIPVPQGQWAGEGAKQIQRAEMMRRISAAQEKLKNARSPEAKRRLTAQIERMNLRLQKGEGPVKFIFRKSVRIPERRFDDWNAQDQRELNEALINKLKEILNG